MLSKEMYDEFEAPYLRKIGRACGPYMYHSCGTFERVLETDIRDPNLMMINFQTKEMNLKTVYAITKGNLPLSVGRSIDLDERYLFPDAKAFYTHLFTEFSEPVAVETIVYEVEPFLEAFAENGGGGLGNRCGVRIQ